MNLVSKVATELGLNQQQVQSAADLLGEGNTIPFITRYRKEKTGSLDEVQLRLIEEGLQRLQMLEERRQTILSSIEEQGKLDDDLKKQLLSCDKLSSLEDLYLPYRPRKRTRAMIAREKGLEPLAAALAYRLTGRSRFAEVLEAAEGGGCPENQDALEGWCGEAEGPVQALEGVKDILAEWINEDASLRTELRSRGEKNCTFVSQLIDKNHAEAAKFRLYEEFRQNLPHLKPHQILALNRGEKLQVLRLKLDWSALEPLELVLKSWLTRPDDEWAPLFRDAASDALDRLCLPSLNRDLRRQLTELAEEHSLKIFASNLKQLLLQPPLVDRVILGLDPGFRSGCKVAVIDSTGRYLEGVTIFPHAPDKRWTQSKNKIQELCKRYGVNVCAIGNGTASQESEKLIAEVISEDLPQVEYTVVSEAGASVYSASDEAREEFPKLDASMRGNISIARRLQDPLAELVKIDPRSLGVGQYQHDVDPRRLGDKLKGVVEDAVNAVGVDLNTASASLLAKVSGVTRRTSKSIISWREEHGSFNSRTQLLDVTGIGPAAFRQCAGFLRIRDGREALDNTAVHPEAYKAVADLAARFSISLAEPVALGKSVHQAIQKGQGLEVLAKEVGLGAPTLHDILSELQKPGRDPRENLDAPILRSGTCELKDLKTGAILEGTVRNLVDFGAFVDIGLKNDGLIHISQLSHRRIKHPVDVLSVGQRLRVSVLEVDLERKRVALSLKALESQSSQGGHGPSKGARGSRRHTRSDSGQGRESSKGGALQDALRKHMSKGK